MAVPPPAPSPRSSCTYRIVPAPGEPYELRALDHELDGDWHVFVVDEQGTEQRVPRAGTSVRRLPSS